MKIRVHWILTLATLWCFGTVSVAQMQTQPPIVPNLVGLSIPQAAAALNRVGLALGNKTGEAWSDAAGLPQNTISVQSIPAGQQSTAGAAVDVTVLRSPNVSLTYNDNEDATPYIYFAYTPQRLILFNHSQTQFMPLSETLIYNNNPNLTPPHQGIRVGEASLYSLFNPVATVAQLAPGQCILFTDGTDPTSSATPQPCDVIARLDIDVRLVFWTSSFDIESATDERTSSCNGATAGQLTICVMPR